MPTVTEYPAVHRDESLVESLHGVSVADPYRWLEDPNAESTKAFVEEQNKVFYKYMADMPLRDKVRQKRCLVNRCLTHASFTVPPAPRGALQL